MLRTPPAWLIAALLAACGDNLPPPPVDAGDPARCEPVAGTALSLRRIAHGCMEEGAPPAPACLTGVVTLATSPPDDPRLFALELNGRIRILDAEGAVQAAPFLDLSVDAGGPVNGVGVTELGLLGLAFHPQYATNRQFYVFYTMDNPDTADAMHPYLDVLARYTTRADDPNRADPDSGVRLISVRDPFANHNGGMIEFGRDGLLYISIGDGGGVAELPADPYNHAQNTRSLLGKMLRIDVDRRDAGLEYAIPATNPYASGVDGAPEVWLRGLRNPWRWSFDPANGDLWLADVGAATWEELNVLPAGAQAGRNMGWPIYEGTSCYAPPCDPAGMTFPLDQRDHAVGWWSIIGGEVYRGSCYPDLVGTYVYTDTGARAMATARYSGGALEVATQPYLLPGNPASMHRDAFGEIVVTDVQGGVYRLVVEPDAQP